VIRGDLTSLARILSATLVGPDLGFVGVSTDSRTLRDRELFVALRGPTFDGHEFVPAAAERGAAAALVERATDTALPLLHVADSLAALGAMAADWRSRFTLPVIAVTGSFGKTTVKEMIAAIAATRGDVLATRGNLNNEIGLPLTLFGLDERHRAAVLELGANHAGEIARLAAIGRPDVAWSPTAGRCTSRASAASRAWRAPRARCSPACRRTAPRSSTSTTRSRRCGGSCGRAALRDLRPGGRRRSSARSR
jgi:UDP-N-acetylmuramoyl-tripeptide--D-alanyl-D-alanine ligase